MNRRRTTPNVVLLLALGLVAVPMAAAKKPDKPGGGGGDGEPSAARLNPAIAFVTVRNGREDVVVAAANLASEIVLTQTIQGKKKGAYTHLFGSPAWSADGASLAFWALDKTNGVTTAQMQLYVATADGTQTRIVRDFRLRPSLHQPPNGHTGGLNWSTTGKELVYEGYHALVAIDVLTGDIRVLLDGFYTDDPVRQPSLSPDLDAAFGYQGIVAMTARDGTFTSDGRPQFDIFTAPINSDADGYLLPIDPALIMNLTDAPGTDENHPSWSPDGSAIACHYDDGTDAWLAVIDMPTGLLLPIYPDYATSGNSQDRATWTSDGRELIYATRESGFVGDLTIIAADGTGVPRNYTNTSTRWEQAPAWNPRWDPAGPGGF